jgi:hypothetical protein
MRLHGKDSALAKTQTELPPTELIYTTPMQNFNVSANYYGLVIQKATQFTHITQHLFNKFVEHASFRSFEEMLLGSQFFCDTAPHWTNSISFGVYPVLWMFELVL